MLEWPHRSAMRLQQSRSAAVITAPGLTHAMTGSAAISSARVATPTLSPSFNTKSLNPTMVGRNASGKVSNYPRFAQICLTAAEQQH